MPTTRTTVKPKAADRAAGGPIGCRARPSLRAVFASPWAYTGHGRLLSVIFDRTCRSRALYLRAAERS